MAELYPSSATLLCPYCCAQIRIPFVVELSSLQRLLRSLGVQPQDPEPLARPPPCELAYEGLET